LFGQDQRVSGDFELRKVLLDQVLGLVDGGLAEKSSIDVDSLAGTPYKHTPSAISSSPDRKLPYVRGILDGIGL